ncbi:MAG: oligoendopeptidase F [Peptostreptococcaceae bacterium]|nr:oligoendopeptidase F [Peptostreptococcaceae bacterium]
MTTKKRNEIDDNFKWNIEDMYKDNALWTKDIEDVLKLTEEFVKLAGHITDSADSLYTAISKQNNIWLKLEKAFVFAHMKLDENTTSTVYQGMNSKCQGVMAKVSASMSFFTPELLSKSKDTITTYIKEDKRLDVYDFYLNSVFREKAHVLSEPEENILAQLSEVTRASSEVFSMLNNADMKFDDVNGQSLTHGNYINYMESSDRSIRKIAYENVYKKYMNQINTIATTYNYSVKTDVISSRIRHYSSSLDSALYGDNIPKAVYTNLIDAVHEHLGSLHDYTELRKEKLGLDDLRMYDIYVPICKPDDKKYTFDDAVDIMKKALAPLGEEYIDILSKGIKSGWVDVYENEGKTSGAYSFGSYDSMPYVLMNFNGNLKDVFTLVHECGHSMHSYYTRHNQPFIYGSHSIFTAEVASTVNEALLIGYLLDNEDNPEIRKYLINFHIEAFRTTLFRQTMFAEFEKITHETIEEGGALTPEFLSTEYEKLNKLYFGDSLSDDEYIKYEWSRIPHFYRAYYVYQYATGYSAATAIANGILTGEDKKREAYLEFLKTGDSNFPVELLKIAGVDMSKKESISNALSTFDDLVKDLRSIL